MSFQAGSAACACDHITSSSLVMPGTSSLVYWWLGAQPASAAAKGTATRSGASSRVIAFSVSGLAEPRSLLRSGATIDVQRRAGRRGVGHAAGGAAIDGEPHLVGPERAVAFGQRCDPPARERA